jgi:hypothetical protein
MENDKLFKWPQRNILYILQKQIPNRVLLLIHNRVTGSYLAPNKLNLSAKPLLGYGFNFIIGILIYGSVGYRTSLLFKRPP